MPLARKLDAEELALLEVIEDPIWLAEFLRSTADGSAQKEEWPKRPFKYRWYQRDIISDRTPNIILTAGRAVGKCHPPNARIFTPTGYRSIQSLLEEKSFAVYGLDADGTFIPCRGFITQDAVTKTYEITTKTGYRMLATANHPVLTQRGYIPLLNLNVEEDKVAVPTRLPHGGTNEIFSWYELRWMGYMLGMRRRGMNNPITLKYNKQVAEMRAIAKEFDAKFLVYDDGKTVELDRKMGYRSFASILSNEVGWGEVRKNGIRTIPDLVKQERLEHLQVMLEAYFSLYAQISPGRIAFNTKWPQLSRDLQETLLKFGIESKIESVYEEHFKETRWYVELLDYRAIYRFFKTFQMPGISVRDIPEPDHVDEPEYYRFDGIESIILSSPSIQTYNITVWRRHNYICDGIIVHNSLVLEDKIIWESINTDLTFPETKEQALFTANTAQMTPILDRLIMRFTSSKFLKDFLQGNVNRSKGTFDFPLGNINYRINARIAGQRGETNTVGLHVNKLKIDEVQLFPMTAYRQLLPALNAWEDQASIFMCGVPTGMREGNVLFYADQVSTKFKKYRVPAHNNPFFTQKDNIEALKQYGGEDSEDYIHLVLGKHGSPVSSVIPREDIVLEPFDFYTYRYHGQEKAAGKEWRTALGTPKLEPDHAKIVVFAIDTGFADPTVIQVFGWGKDLRWRTLIRYRLTRVPFPDQIQIIDWLDGIYNPAKIGIDAGAGGGGITIIQDLISDKYPKQKKYANRIEGVRFSDRISIGENSDGTSLDLIGKAYGGQQLAKMIAEKELIFSELDMEGVSQLERVAYQRTADGNAKYFVLSERGIGASGDDHIFASYVVFVISLLHMSLYKPARRLFGARWL